MERIDIAKILLKYIGTESVEADRAIAQGIIVILNGVGEPDPVQKQDAPERTETEQPAKISAENFQGRVKQRRGGRPPFDTGKMRALLKAGWSIAKIADEMGVTETTIRKHCKEEGLLKDEQAKSV